MLQNDIQYLTVYVIGFVLMIFFLVRSFIVKDKNLINMPGIEKDEKKFKKVRFVYTLTQIICLVLFTICFIYAKNFYVAIIAFSFGILMPICAALVYDTIHIRSSKKED